MKEARHKRVHTVQFHLFLVHEEQAKLWWEKSQSVCLLMGGSSDWPKGYKETLLYLVSIYAIFTYVNYYI